MNRACLLFFVGALAGCSEEPTTATGGGGLGAGASASGGAGAQGGAGGGTGGDAGSGGGYACEPPGFTPEDVTESVDTVSGSVLDLQGAPVAMVLADVCGTNICLAGETESNGDFAVSGNPSDVVDARLVYGDGRTHAKMAARLPQFPSADVGTIHTPRLPPFTDGAPIIAGEDATQNGVTLHVPAGAQIDHDIFLYEETERGFRAVLFAPGDGNFPGIPASLSLEVLIGLGPIHALICPGVGLTFENRAGWDPGAAVQILYNSVEVFPSFAPYGDWAVVAEATVSDDGATVSTNEGENIAELGTLGARLAE